MRERIARLAAHDIASRVATPAQLRAWSLDLFVLGGLITGMLTAPALWFGPRAFPVAPLVPLTSAMHATRDLAVAQWVGAGAVGVGCLVGVLTWRARAMHPHLRGLVLTVLAVAAATDQHRLQPWIFFYALLLLVNDSSRAPDRLRSDPRVPEVVAERGLHAAAIVVAATYLFSGLHKLNPDFSTNVLAAWWRALGSFGGLDRQLSGTTLQRVGVMVALAEAAVGPALLVPRARRLAVCGAVAIHVTILLVLGPLGRDVNIVVWPWNATMLLLLWRLFGSGARPRWPVVRQAMRGARYRLAFALISIGPLLSMIDRWDQYLGFGVYTGNATRGSLRFRPAFARCLPMDAALLATDVTGAAGASFLQLSLLDWSFDAMKVPPVPEPRTLRGTARQLCACATPSDSLTLDLAPRRTIRGEPARLAHEAVCVLPHKRVSTTH